MKRTLRIGLLCGLAAAGLLMSHNVGALTDGATTVTFTKDVAPVLQKNCLVCHRAGEIAPMSLVSYKEARPWAKSIKEMVVERRMPPWFADPRHGEFSNDCRLSQKEIDTLVAWADSGATEGDPKDMPPPRKFAEGWTIGKPDVVLSMVEEYNISAEGVIPYQSFTVPTNFTEDRYVQFAEVRAGNRTNVHHIIVDVRYPNQSRSVEQGGNPRGADSDGRLVGWAPGEAALLLRPGQAKLVKAGSSLVFQVHYTTNGVPAKDRSSIGLIFSKTPVEKRVITHAAAARGLAIPAGDPNYESRSTFTFKENSHIVSLHPHMHFRGKDFEFRLVYPDGRSTILLSVPRWDFNWQLTYFLKYPVAAPRDSRLECLAHHDNSAKNKFNPDPTKLVEWGPQTWEEMMVGWFDYTIDRQNLQVRSETAAK